MAQRRQLGRGALSVSLMFSGLAGCHGAPSTVFERLQAPTGPTLAAAKRWTCYVSRELDVSCWGDRNAPEVEGALNGMTRHLDEGGLVDLQLSDVAQCVLADTGLLSCSTSLRAGVWPLEGVSEFWLADRSVCAAVSNGVRCATFGRGLGREAWRRTHGWFAVAGIGERPTRLAIDWRGAGCARLDAELWCWGARTHDTGPPRSPRGPRGARPARASMPWLDHGRVCVQMGACEGPRASCVEPELELRELSFGGVTCGIDDANAVHCAAPWLDDTGAQAAMLQLTEAALEPTTFVEIPNVQATKVAVGATHVCVVTTNSSVVCWGDNQVDQLEVPRALAPR